MGGGKWLRHSRDFKVAVVARMLAGENVAALARELGISRQHMYAWRLRYLEAGEAGLRGAGRPRVEPPGPVAAGEPGRERLAALERKIGQQELELDFFRHALQHIEASRRASDGPSGTASTATSRPGRSGKAD